MTPGQGVRFYDEGVKDARRTFLLKIQNVYQFFQEYATLDGFDPRPTGFVGLGERTSLDRWVLSTAESVTRDVRAALDAYDFHTAATVLEAFVDGLSNWYVRRSRDRAWSAATVENTEKWALWWTLYEILVQLTKLMAPFTPFLAEELHGALVRRLGRGEPSVHLERYPVANEARIDRDLEATMELARKTAALGKRARLEAKLKVRQPLLRAIVLLSSSDDAARLERMRLVVEEELNVKAVELSTEYDRYVQFDVFPDWKSIGKRLGKRFRGKDGQEVLNKALRALGPRTVAASVRVGAQVVVDPGDGQGALTLDAPEVLVRLAAREGFAAAEEHGVVLVLDARIDESLRLEALAADIRGAIQAMRKAQRLPYDARIEIRWSPEGELTGALMGAVLDRHGAWLQEQTLAVRLDRVDAGDAPGGASPEWLGLADEGRVLLHRGRVNR
jgi:isoleucyl-tRNA synthetase